jgi:hypothetical protein
LGDYIAVFIARRLRRLWLRVPLPFFVLTLLLCGCRRPAAARSAKEFAIAEQARSDWVRDGSAQADYSAALSVDD